MRVITRGIALLAVALCVPACNGDESKFAEGIVNTITSNEYCVTWAQRVKKTFKGKETDKKYIEARDLYDAAKAQNNAYLKAVDIFLASPSGSEATKKASEDAGTAAKAFVVKAKPIVDVSTIPPSGTPIISDIGEFIIKAGVAIWETAEKIAKAKRDEARERLKVYQWREWDSISSD